MGMMQMDMVDQMDMADVAQAVEGAEVSRRWTRSRGGDDVIALGDDIEFRNY